MPPRLLWRTDVHLSDHTPVSRTDNWREVVLRKLKFVGDCARDRGVHAVLDGGDFFDIKNPSRNSHSLVRETADIHSQYTCPTYANVGNHDCVYGNIQYLPQQPLGVLFSTGVFRRCYDQHEAFFTQDGINVRVVGVPYHGVRYDLDRFRSIKKGSEDYLVVMGHVLASPQGGEMFEGEDILKYSDVDSFDGDVFCFGHWHKDQGVFTTPNGKSIVNTGSLTRGALSQDNLDRKPKVVFMEFTQRGINIEEIHVPCEDSSFVFDLHRKQQETIREESFEGFADTLKSFSKQTGKKDLRARVRELPLEFEVREGTLSYLEKRIVP
jgi:DNA repair exonuclease SbcCD nuclease subunit